MNLRIDLSCNNEAEQKKISLSEAAYGQILDWILSGELKAGQVLQERRLAELLEISRTPVREALGRLEAEHLMVRGHGRLLVVTELSVEGFVHLLDMRHILETEAAARATGHTSSEAAARVEQAIDALLAAENPTPAEHWAVDDLVHNTIAQAAGNPVIEAAIFDLRRRTRLFDTRRIAHRLLPGAEEHRALIRAASGSDPTLTRNLMGAHLDKVRNAIIDFILGRRP